MERLPLAEAYASLLASAGVVRGLIGPRETPRLWTRHLLNSAVLAEQVPPGATVVDVGSGAGLPGLPLAIARPDTAVTLVEPLLRRATFLEQAVTEMGLGNVTVIRARSEDLHARDDLAPGFDVVTSRAVAPLAQLLEWCMPLVAPHGAMVALKGASATEEVGAAARVVASWGCSTPELVVLGRMSIPEPTHAVVVRWGQPSTVTWPVRRPSGGASRRSTGPARRRRRSP